MLDGTVDGNWWTFWLEGFMFKESFFVQIFHTTDLFPSNDLTSQFRKIWTFGV